MKRKFEYLIIVLCSFWLTIGSDNIFSLTLWAKTSHGISLDRLKNNIHEFTLKNGLKVIILEKHTSPTVALKIFFKVGSVNERPGITGISHIIEHMLFKGTTTIGTKNYQREQPILERIDWVVNRLAELEKTPRGHASAEKQEAKLLKEELTSLYTKHQTYVVRQ